MYEHQPTKPQLIQRKHQTFRVDIRRRQIEQHLQTCRKKYILFKTKHNYHLLQHINLPQTIKQFKNDPHNRQLIHNMFLYASSEEADHLYYHFQDDLLFSLIDQLNQQPFTLKQRQILIIWSNYTAYHPEQQYPEECIEKLLAIAKANNKKQITSNIIMALTNMVSCSSIAVMLTKNVHLLQQVSAMFQAALQKPTQNQQLIQYHCGFYQNLFQHSYYQQIPSKMQKKALSLLIESLQSIERETIMKHVLGAFRNLFGNSLDENPSLILKYKGLLYQIAEWAYSYSQSDKSKISLVIVDEYLGWLKIIFGINVPEQDSKEILEFYRDYFEKELEPMCEWIFSIKKQCLTNCLLDLLRLILLEKELSQTFLDQNYKIFMQILQHAEQSSGLRAAKDSLICIVNMVKTLANDPDTKYQFSFIITNHSIQELLQKSIGRFTDPQLNMELLEGIQVLSCCSEEGIKRIEKLIDQTSSEEVKAVGIRTLDSLNIIQ